MVSVLPAPLLPVPSHADGWRTRRRVFSRTAKGDRQTEVKKICHSGIMDSENLPFCTFSAYFDILTENSNKTAKIQCALFKGTARDIFIDKEEFAGSIYRQVEDAYQFVLRHINTGAVIEGIYGNDHYEVPLSAVREMIANAVVHRLWKASHNIGTIR